MRKTVERNTPAAIWGKLLRWVSFAITMVPSSCFPMTFVQKMYLRIKALSKLLQPLFGRSTTQPRLNSQKSLSSYAWYLIPPSLYRQSRLIPADFTAKRWSKRHKHDERLPISAYATVTARQEHVCAGKRHSQCRQTPLLRELSKPAGIIALIYENKSQSW